MPIAQFVVWDLGATKCAAAMVTYQNSCFHIQKQCSLKLLDFTSLYDLTSALEQSLGISFTLMDAICIAGAGQYNHTELLLDKGGHKGYPYPMLFAELAKSRHWQNLFVVHDYTPIVCRSFIPDEHDIQTIHSGQANPHGRRIAFGIGTGLGMKDAITLPDGHLWIGTNEIGHIGLSHPPTYSTAEFEEHQELVNFIARHHSQGAIPITFESILSGPGLALLHQFATELPKPLLPEETAKALAGTSNSRTLQLFARYLGLFIGVVQLAFMPSGGIWMTGGVLDKHPTLFTQPLLAHLERGIALSTSYQIERQQFPLKVMLGQNHAFLGGAFFLAQQLRL